MKRLNIHYRLQIKFPPFSDFYLTTDLLVLGGFVWYVLHVASVSRDRTTKLKHMLESTETRNVEYFPVTPITFSQEKLHDFTQYLHTSDIIRKEPLAAVLAMLSPPLR